MSVLLPLALAGGLAVASAAASRGGPAATRTAAFRRWFGASQVVDAQGRPRVVYHGTDRAFDAFDPGQAGARTQGGAWGGPALYFSSSPRIASGYADRHGGNVLPVYLRIRRPFVVEGRGRSWRDVFPGIVTTAREAGHDGLVVRDVVDNARFWDADARGDVFVVFTPEQVKSALGNRGTFDRKDPRISFNRDEATIGYHGTDADGARGIARRGFAVDRARKRDPGDLPTTSSVRRATAPTSSRSRSIRRGSPTSPTRTSSTAARR